MIFKKVVAIIVDHLDVEDVDSVKLETSLMKDLDADSLDAVEIMMALEDEFDIVIPDEEAEKFENIGNIVTYIEGKTE